MKRASKVRISFVISLILGVCLVFGSYFFSKSLARWKRLKRALLVARQEQSKAEAVRRELLRRDRIMTRLGNLVNRARELGLTPEQWDQYDVEVQQAITFPQLSTILRQTNTGNNYYFEPMFIYLLKSQPRKEGGEQPPSTEQEKPSTEQRLEPDGGDIFLKLKGRFLVRK